MPHRSPPLQSVSRVQPAPTSPSPAGTQEPSAHCIPSAHSPAAMQRVPSSPPCANSHVPSPPQVRPARHPPESSSLASQLSPALLPSGTFPPPPSPSGDPPPTTVPSEHAKAAVAAI